MKKRTKENLYDVLSEERKQLQEQGLVPLWYTTASYQMFKEKYEYETNGRSVLGQFERIAKTAAQYLKGTALEKEAEQQFFNLLWKGWLSPSTPVLANMGTNRGMSVSCSGGYIADSIDGFYSSLHEVAMLTKYGFGTSGYLGDIRPRGSKISVGGKASGVVPVFKTYVQTMREVAQGTARRGAFAGYLPIDHADFDELVDHVTAEPDDANIGWNVSNEFISKLDQGDTEALRRFQRAMKMKMVTGKGYFIFPDKINAKRPEAYVKNNLDVKASNLCVAPETLILTDAGYQTISELDGEFVNVWNGREYSNVQVVKTGTNQKLVRVVTNSGFELECTPYHKFYVVKNYQGGVVEKRANELKEGDKLIKSNFPIIQGTEVLANPYDNGFFSADGCYTTDGKRVYLYHDKRNLKKHLTASYKSWYTQENLNREYGHSDELLDKFFVPIGNYTISSKLEWFAGLCDGDGTVARCENTQSIQVGSTNKQFLLDVQLMLQTLGVSSKVTIMHEAGIRKLPLNDGSGLNGDFNCQASYRLLIGQSGICTLQDLGFKTFRLQLTDHRPNRECTQFVKIVAVIDENRYDDTYCFTEPKRHMGVFNGLLTGQCSEITLYSDKDHTFSCVLSSMNVSKYDEWKDTAAVFWATIFLDCVAEDFIQKSKGINGLQKAALFTEKGRALGLGQCGFHTLCQSKGLDFEGLAAHLLSNEIAKHIWDESLDASKYLAELLGEPEWCKGLGIRNTHRIAIAPTKSTGLLMGGISEGINPDPAMTFTQLTSAGEVERINPVLLQLMKDKGVYTKKHIDEVVENQGSVQKVDWLTEDEKAAFKTAFEINQKSILRLASSRARYIDQWQSLNLFFAADESPEWIAEVHADAFHDPNILGLYYIYTQAGTVGSKECVACQ